MTVKFKILHLTKKALWKKLPVRACSHVALFGGIALVGTCKNVSETTFFTSLGLTLFVSGFEKTLNRQYSVTMGNE